MVMDEISITSSRFCPFWHMVPVRRVTYAYCPSATTGSHAVIWSYEDICLGFAGSFRSKINIPVVVPINSFSSRRKRVSILRGTSTLSTMVIFMADAISTVFNLEGMLIR